MLNPSRELNAGAPNHSSSQNLSSIYFQAPVITSGNQNTAYVHPVATYDFLLPFDQLLQKANAGDPSAQFLVGRALVSGEYGLKVDKKVGEEWIILSANNTHQGPASQCAKGYCLGAGIDGNIKDISTANEYYQKSIDGGYIPARRELARLLLDQSKSTDTYYGNGKFAGQSVTEETRDPAMLKQLIAVLTPAAQAKYIPAMAFLAYCYRNGYGVKQDHAYAFSLFEQTASSGYAFAKQHVADYYYGGMAGVTKDVDKANALYQECFDQGTEIVNSSFKPELPKSSSPKKRGSCSVM